MFQPFPSNERARKTAFFPIFATHLKFLISPETRKHLENTVTSGNDLRFHPPDQAKCIFDGKLRTLGFGEIWTNPSFQWPENFTENVRNEFKRYRELVSVSSEKRQSVSSASISKYGGKHSISNRKEGRKWKDNTNQKAPDGFSRLEVLRKSGMSRL